MDYHLNRQGQNLGVFSLEELRRRRQAGELAGTENVWCEGMPDWMPLDAILQQNAPSAAPVRPPPPPPNWAATQRSKRILKRSLWTGFALAALAVMGTLGWVFVKSFQAGLTQARQVARQRVAAITPPDALIAAAKPVTWTSNTLTEAGLQKKRGEFRRRQWLEGYLQHGNHQAPCDAEARQYIQTWLSRNYDHEPATNLPSTAAWGDTLANTPGCDDPLVLTVAGINCIETHEQIRRLQRALDGFKNSPHKAYPKFWAALTLGNDLSDQPGRRQAADARAVAWFKELLADGSLLPEDQPEITRIMVIGAGKSFFERNRTALCEIAAEAGQPYQWLSLVLDGNLHIIEGWKARGGGYSDTVTPAGWQAFARHLDAARTDLTRAWELRPDRPVAPMLMIYVTLGTSGIAEMRLWFDRSVAAQIDYPDAWSQMRWGLRPRWYGSPQAMLEFGITALNTKRFDTDVPRKFFDVITDLESEASLPAGQHLYGRPDIWPHLREMYEGYVAAPAQLSDRDGWRSSYAAVAFLAKKYDVARAQLEAVNWKPGPRNLAGWGLDMSLMSLEVAARTGSAGQSIAAAENASQAGDVPQAIRLYTTILAKPNLDDRTKDFVRRRLAALDLERRLGAGGWVDFLPAGKDDPAWVFDRGQFQRLPDGALEVRSGADGHFCYSLARVGPSFEVKGQFEVAHSSTADFQAGLILGQPGDNDYAWYGFRLKRNLVEGDVACFSREWSQYRSFQGLPLHNVTNSFDFMMQDGLYTVSVNGRQIFSRKKPLETIRIRPEDFRVGFGAYNDMNETVLRYRDVQLRKLPPAPTAPR